MPRNLSPSNGEIPPNDVNWREEMLVYDSLPSELRYFIRNWCDQQFCGAISMNKIHFLTLYKTKRRYKFYPYLEENEPYPEK